MAKKYGSLAVKKSHIHGKGVFADKEFAKGDLIGKYTGKKVQKDATHVLWIWEGDSPLYGIAGEAPLMYLNHSSKPNAEFHAEELYATKKIQLGDEITFHYGEEWEEVE